MVEALEVQADSPGQRHFKAPDEMNHHRTLNIAAPYGKSRPKPPSNDQEVGRRALLAAEAELGEEKVVLMGWTRPEESVKAIEQVGKAYEALKQKYAKLAERIEQGEQAHFDSTDEADSEEEKKEGDFEDEEEADAGERKEEFQRKRKTKTKA